MSFSRGKSRFRRNSLATFTLFCMIRVEIAVFIEKQAFFPPLGDIWPPKVRI